MNILVCTYRLPFFPLAGDSLRIFQIFKELSKNNNIFLLYRENCETERIAALNKLNIFQECIHLDLPEYSTIQKTRLFFQGFLGYDDSASLLKSIVHRKLESIVKTLNIDIIHAHDYFISMLIFDYKSVPKLLDLTDSHGLYYRRELKLFQKPTVFLKSVLRFIATQSSDNFLIKNFDITTVVSKVDAAYLNKTNKDADIRVIPNGIDTNYFSPLEVSVNDEPSIVFSGTMSFSPNINSVIYIYNNILPIIKSEIPNIKFYIVGSNPPPVISKLTYDESIIVTGYVDDIRIYLHNASVILAPMQSGSGIKNKILEGMSMGKPVVTNYMGAEAFDEEVIGSLFIGNTPKELANHVIQLIQNEEKRQYAGHLGRKLLIEKYSWHTTAKQYEDVYYQLLDRAK